MKKVAIIGKFHTENGLVADGQTVKTNILTQELERVFGTDQVTRISTFDWKKNPFSLFFKSIVAVSKHENVMFLTDEGGIKIFPTLLRLANFRKKCKLHYYVVGGWLSRYLDRSEPATKKLKKLDAVYVEIPAMLRELEERGFENGVLVNKFRRLNPASSDEIDLNPKPPFKLCYFSRVNKEKGVEEAVSAVKLANERAGYVKYTLDIFGFINDYYQEQFQLLQKDFPDYISYKGVVDFQHSSKVLKDYFAMLFPTYFASEGYPNTIVDSFAAGLPVIATRWNYNADIVQDNIDGVLVDVGNVEQIADAVDKLSGDMEAYRLMRLTCLARCAEYQPENAINKVIDHLK